MRKDLAKPKIKQSFLNAEKDVESIIRKLFVESQPHSNILKRLLVISAKDCLDKNNMDYEKIAQSYTVDKLYDENYITLIPTIPFKEHEDVKNYIIIGVDNFIQNPINTEFRDCHVTFDIICNIDNWDIGDYRIRPLKIAGYIDGILDDARLSGIGTFQFLSCQEVIINEELGGYTLSYRAVHGSDDYIPDGETYPYDR